MYRNKFTILQLFRTARVLERCDYMAVWLVDKEKWQVIKGKGDGSINGPKTLVSEDEHKELMFHASNPIILDSSYLETDEDGLVIFGW